MNHIIIAITASLMYLIFLLGTFGCSDRDTTYQYDYSNHHQYDVVNLSDICNRLQNVDDIVDVDDHSTVRLNSNGRCVINVGKP